MKQHQNLIACALLYIALYCSYLLAITPSSSSSSLSSLESTSAESSSEFPRPFPPSPIFSDDDDFEPPDRSLSQRYTSAISTLRTRLDHASSLLNNPTPDKPTLKNLPPELLDRIYNHMEAARLIIHPQKNQYSAIPICRKVITDPAHRHIATKIIASSLQAVYWRIYHVTDHGELSPFYPPLCQDTDNILNSFWFLPDGKSFLLTDRTRRRITLYSMNKAHHILKHITTIPDKRGTRFSHVSPDGRYLIFKEDRQWGRENFTNIHKTETGELLFRVPGSCYFSPRGTFIILEGQSTGDPDILCTLDQTTEALTKICSLSDICCFSPNERFLLTRNSGDDKNDTLELHDLTIPNTPRCIAKNIRGKSGHFSQDGSTLIITKCGPPNNMRYGPPHNTTKSTVYTIDEKNTLHVLAKNIKHRVLCSPDGIFFCVAPDDSPRSHTCHVYRIDQNRTSYTHIMKAPSDRIPVFSSDSQWFFNEYLHEKFLYRLPPHGKTFVSRHPLLIDVPEDVKRYLQITSVPPYLQHTICPDVTIPDFHHFDFFHSSSSRTDTNIICFYERDSDFLYPEPSHHLHTAQCKYINPPTWCSALLLSILSDMEAFNFSKKNQETLQRRMFLQLFRAKIENAQESHTAFEENAPYKNILKQGLEDFADDDREFLQATYPWLAILLDDQPSPSTPRLHHASLSPRCASTSLRNSSPRMHKQESHQ